MKRVVCVFFWYDILHALSLLLS